MADYVLIGVQAGKPYYQAVLELMERFACKSLAIDLSAEYQNQFDALSMGADSLDDLSVFRVLSWDGADVAELKTLVARATERGLRLWCIGEEAAGAAERLLGLKTPVAVLCSKEQAAKQPGPGVVTLGALLPAGNTVSVLVLAPNTIPPQPPHTLEKFHGDYDYRYWQHPD